MPDEIVAEAEGTEAAVETFHSGDEADKGEDGAGGGAHADAGEEEDDEEEEDRQQDESAPGQVKL